MLFMVLWWSGGLEARRSIVHRPAGDRRGQRGRLSRLVRGPSTAGALRWPAWCALGAGAGGMGGGTASCSASRASHSNRPARCRSAGVLCSQWRSAATRVGEDRVALWAVGRAARAAAIAKSGRMCRARWRPTLPRHVRTSVTSRGWNPAEKRSRGVELVASVLGLRAWLVVATTTAASPPSAHEGGAPPTPIAPVVHTQRLGPPWPFRVPPGHGANPSTRTRPPSSRNGTSRCGGDPSAAAPPPHHPRSRRNPRAGCSVPTASTVHRGSMRLDPRWTPRRISHPPPPTASPRG